MSNFARLRRDIVEHPMNASMSTKHYEPIYTASHGAGIAIIGQAPGIRAQLSGKPFNDASGRLLRQWLGVSEEQFYDPELIALTPMDFYYPGKASHGDLPPRHDFAPKWHPRLFAMMPDIRLIVLVGAYSQKYYLKQKSGANLTDTVLGYEKYLPDFFPIVHPGPLNIGWRARNPWFEAEVVPELRQLVASILEEV